KVRGGQLDGGGDHRRAVAHVDRRQRIAIGNGLDDLLHAGAADHKHFTFAASLLDGFDRADGDVVVLGPNGLDVREAGQEVLHHAEAVVTVPVGELVVQNGDIRAFNAS